MSLYLLDVNLLVALAWPDHVLHAAAQRWFADSATDGWATSPVTDVHLAAVAARHGGRLATLDRGVAEALHPDDRALVTLVPVT